MPRTKEQAFPIIIQRDEHGQYYVQKTFSDNVAMEEWLQKFTNQRLQINNLKRDLQRANNEIKKLPKKIIDEIRDKLLYDYDYEPIRGCLTISSITLNEILDNILKKYEE